MVGTRSVGHKGIALIYCIAVGVGSARAANPAQYSKAVVYYRAWWVESRQRLQPTDVREHADCVWTLSDRNRVQRFREWLQVPRCTSKKSRPEDARLVIDFVSEEGETETYYASTFHLLTADSKCARAIDDVFKKCFVCRQELRCGG